MELFNMAECSPIGTPMYAKLPTINNPDEPLSGDKDRPYAQVVG